MTKIFIDGSAGTTGLRIRERLAERKDLTLLSLPDELRKDPDAKREILKGADIAFLCLPDDAARETVSLAEGTGVRIIDTSTAHRTADGWTYGFAELGNRAAIKDARLVANPGCHASGFLALVAPLVKAGVLKADAALTCFSLTGYSGGGKKMIADYEDEASPLYPVKQYPRQYALGQKHKHLPEMQRLAGLSVTPVICPVVGDFYAGMEVTVPVFARDLCGTLADVKAVYREAFSTGLVHFVEENTESGFLSAGALSGRDDMEVYAEGNDERMLLVSRFDNLGKGASGAAIQNMNIMLGVDEALGLNVK